ncbi:hypothetical protein OAG20_03205 [Verrucomicrobiales bacterium]|nr:hypothetical protein [Verrucomicrobiales bacterium]
MSADGYRSFAIRKTVAETLNGFRECFEHQGKKRYLALRLLSQGGSVRYGSSALLRQ